MFGSMKKAMVAAAAVAAIGVVAPAAASADRWQADNPTVLPYNGPAHTSGALTLTLTATGATTTCNVTGTLDLTHLAGVAHGQVTSFLLTGCTTNAPNCSVTASATTPVSTLPWTVATAGTSVTISGITFTNTYSGASCALNGVSLTATGSITGTATAGSNAIVFTNAAGLSTPAGPATVNGTVRSYVENAAGGPNTSRPITLVP